MTTTPALRFTAEEMIAKMHERLSAARVELRQAELRGCNEDVALGRVLALAGMLATLDPEVAGDDEFIPRMANVEEVATTIT